MNLVSLVGAARQIAVYVLIGTLLFVLVWWLLGKLVPFSLVKELGEKRNPALAVILLSILVGLGIIVSASISS